MAFGTRLAVVSTLSKVKLSYTNCQGNRTRDVQFDQCGRHVCQILRDANGCLHQRDPGEPRNAVLRKNCKVRL